MLDCYPLIRPLLWRLDPETAHKVALRFLANGIGFLVADPAADEPDPPELAQRLFGLEFLNPVGLAAGFDKDAIAPDQLIRWFHFGFIEVGTITPENQSGNPGLRIFRLAEDGAVINRMGFPSEGLDKVVPRLARRRRRKGAIVGVNIGKNKNSIDAVHDFERCIRSTARYADYLVVNISSPNTPGLRNLQRRDALEKLLTRLLEVRREIKADVPLLVKLAPDLDADECDDVAHVLLSVGIDGAVISNTTVQRPTGLKSRDSIQAGGLSGRPLFKTSTKLLSELYERTEGKIPLIGVGGIASAEDAYEKICAGASLVQIHTGFVFDKNLTGKIRRDVTRLLRRDGFSTITEAIGSRTAVGAIRSVASKLKPKELQQASRLAAAG